MRARPAVLAATHASARRAASAGGSPAGAGNGRPRAAPRRSPPSTWPASTSACQRRQQPALAQRRLAAAADQLQRLHQEFDFADAAGAALDVVGEFLARDFRVDHRLHLAQAVERAVVEVAAVDERTQRRQEAFAGGDVAGDRPRLLPGIALPVAAFALEVLLHRRERQRHAPGVAERPQAQVDAMAEAVGGDFVEQLRQLLAEPREVVLGRERTRAIALSDRRRLS